MAINPTVVYGPALNSGAGTTLTGTTDWDFTGLTGDATGTVGYRLLYDLTFSVSGQGYFQLNGDAGNNYDENWYGAAVATPATPISGEANGQTLFDLGFGAQLTTVGKVSGEILFTSVKSTSARVQASGVVNSYDSSTGKHGSMRMLWTWINSSAQLTRIRVRHTGTVTAGSCTLFTLSGA